MRAKLTLLAMGLLIPVIGCNNPPPPRVNVPTDTRGNPYSTYDRDPVKPDAQAQPTPQAPPQTAQPTPNPPAPPAQPSAPPILVPPAPPAAVPQSYLDSYDRVGRPRLFVIVDRTGGTQVALMPGTFEAIEKTVHAALASGGAVAVAPAALILEKLGNKPIEDTQVVLASAGSAVHADVIVRVRLLPPPGGTGDAQLAATAKNTRDGQQIASAVAPIASPPMTRQVDAAGRQLGEKMVGELTKAWDTLARQSATQPVTQPAAQS